MKIEVHNSGNKHTVKVTPTIREIIPATNFFHRLPDPAKGKLNPSHWHVKGK
jgi:hypothetical protein